MSSVPLREMAGVLDAALPGRPLPWTIVAVAMLGIWITLFAARPDLLVTPPPEYDQDHALLSMDIAIGQALCGGPTKISTLLRLPYEARDHAELRSQPIREVVIGRAGSLEKFCLTVGSPIINNENALMWLDTWIVKLSPGVSLDGLAAWLHLLRLISLVLCSAAMLRLGAGVLATLLTVFSALVVLRQIGHLGLTAYPLDFVLLLSVPAFGALVATTGVLRSGRGMIVVAILGGMLTAFGAHVRTSHLAVYLTTIVLVFGYAERSRRSSWRAHLVRGVAVVAAVVLGFVAFQQIAIIRHLPRDIAASPNHSTWHSIVLSLATPANDLSRRERIEWSDGAAWDLALRKRLGVRYLSEDYEAALRSYYRELWDRDPKAMLGIYSLKIHTAGKQMIEVLRGTPGRDNGWLWWVLRPADLLPHGGYVFAAYLALTLAGLVLAWRGNEAGLLLLLVSASAVLLQCESILITSLYTPHYHAFLAFYLIEMSFMVPLALAGAAWRVARARFPAGL